MPGFFDEHVLVKKTHRLLTSAERDVSEVRIHGGEASDCRVAYRLLAGLHAIDEVLRVLVEPPRVGPRCDPRLRSHLVVDGPAAFELLFGIDLPTVAIPDERAFVPDERDAVPALERTELDAEPGASDSVASKKILPSLKRPSSRTS